MLDIDKLEKRWLVWKLKANYPYFIVFILLVVLSYTAYTYLLYPKKVNLVEQKVIIQEIVVSPKTSQEIQKVIIEEKVIEKPKKKNIVIPSLKFMQNLEKRDISEVQKSVPKKKETSQKHIKKEIPQRDNKTITIKREDSYKDIDEVIKRFHKNQNPALSLFVAKKYYQLGEYEKSYNYALLTNNLNSKIEPSWILFAKSLVKLHKKTKAIDVLKKYIKLSNSTRAKNLLNEINKGIFR